MEIHGCVDGFSRQIIWLNAGVSNKNPNIIATYYIESIRKHNTYPRRLRADLGTENVHVETIQKLLREEITEMSMLVTVAFRMHMVRARKIRE